MAVRCGVFVDCFACVHMIGLLAVLASADYGCAWCCCVWVAFVWFATVAALVRALASVLAVGLAVCEQIFCFLIPNLVCMQVLLVKHQVQFVSQTLFGVCAWFLDLFWCGSGFFFAAG